MLFLLRTELQNSKKPSMSIKEALGWATDYFQKNNIENPHLEAEILLAHALKLKRIDLYIKFEEIVSAEVLAKFKDYITRRKNHEPTAYITGIKAFMSLDFTVTRDVLIPRPETEILVEAAIGAAKEFESPIILDIGTGSGALSVSIAKYLPSAKIHATDVSQKAIEIAGRNAKTHSVSERINFEAADLFPKAAGIKFDVIVANPPYIKSSEIEKLMPEIRNYEPLSALDGGADGLDFYRAIIPKAKDYLKDSGALILEIDPNLLEGVKKLLSESFFRISSIKKDLNDLNRAVIANSKTP